MATRARKAQGENRNVDQKLAVLPVGGTKRPLESDVEGNQKKKRVFGDITNRENNKIAAKKGLKKATITTKGKTRTVIAVPKAKKTTKEDDGPGPTLSQTSLKSEDLSWDVLELSQESKSSQSSQSSSADSTLNENNLILSQEAKELLQKSSEPLDDIDKENINDPFHVSLYAPFIFNYYKEREAKFEISDYMNWQTDITPHMRAILVDWLVEVQENFELNHETLYLAVKLVDLFMNVQKVSKERVQLVGATSLFIACKFDERCPPMLDDFLYICDDAYQRHELISMEQKILHAVNFDLGIPLSYRFLRRYAKCARSSILTLTLARYILESSQMDYNFIKHRDSYRASAALLLAMKMDTTGTWSSTMVHFTGYTENELIPLVRQLNSMVSAAAASKLSTIRVKYSHAVFHEVAKIPALDILELQVDNNDSVTDGSSNTTSASS